MGQALYSVMLIVVAAESVPSPYKMCYAAMPGLVLFSSSYWEAE